MAPLETVERIEPARLDAAPESIADTLADLSAVSATLGQALHPRTAANLADLVRIMNTHYERALAGQLDQDEGRRNLQLKAAAPDFRNGRHVGP